MKQIIYTLILLIVLFSCKKDEGNSDNTGTKKDIVSITENWYYGVLQNGSIQKSKLYEKKVTNFDTKGWITDITKYSSTGKINDVGTFTYSGNNFELKWNSQTWKGLVNDNGKMLSCDAYSNGSTNPWGEYIWIYDNNGFLTEETMIENDDSWTCKTTIENNEDGDPIKAFYSEKPHYSEDYILKENYTFEYKTYDSKENWTYSNEICTNSDGSIDYGITEREITYK